MPEKHLCLYLTLRYAIVDIGTKSPEIWRIYPSGTPSRLVSESVTNASQKHFETELIKILATCQFSFYNHESHHTCMTKRFAIVSGIALGIAITGILVFRSLDNFSDLAGEPTSATDTLRVNRLVGLAEKLSGQARFDSSNTCYAQAASIYEAEKNWEFYITCKNNIGDNFRKAGLYDKAQAYLDSTFVESIGLLGRSNAAVAMCINKLGLLRRDQGEFDEALKGFNEALEIRIKVLPKNHVDIGWSYNNIGLVNWDLGYLDEAVRMFNKAVAVFQQSAGVDFWGTAMAYNNLGNVLLEKGNYAKALEYYENALSIRTKIFGPNNISVAQTLINLGTLYHRKLDFDEAIKYYNRALRIWIERLGNEHPDVARCYYNIGFVYKDKEDYANAYRFYSLALEIRRKKLGEKHPDVARTYDEMSRVMFSKAEYDSSLDYIQKALKIWQQVENAGNVRIAYEYRHLAYAYSKQAKFRSAFDFHNKALEIYVKHYGLKHPEVSQSYADLADVFLETKDLNRALVHYDLAIKTLLIGQDSVLVDRFPSSASIPDLPRLASFLARRGDVLEKIYASDTARTDNLRLAAIAYEGATEAVQKIRQDFKSSESKLFFGTKSRSVFDHALALYYRLYRITGDGRFLDKAFLMMEKGKSYVVLETLSDAKAKILAGVPDTLLEYERQLKTLMSFYTKKLLSEQTKSNNAAAVKTFENRIFELQQQHAEYVKIIEKNYPQYYQLKFNLKPVTIGELQKSFLDKETAIVEYFMTDTALFTCVIRSSDVQLFQTPKDRMLVKNIETLRKSLVERNFAAYCQSGYYLYGELVSPIAAYLKVKHLIVVPDAQIAYIPFDALIKSKADQNSNYQNLSYLIYDFDISYTYSSTLLMEISIKENKRILNNLIGFSPVEFR